jgi:hypothetical protein
MGWCCRRCEAWLPLSDAAIKLVAWATHGVLRPSGDDCAMLRLVLLALLPQIGGKQPA